MTWNLCRIGLSCPFCVAGVALWHGQLSPRFEFDKLKSFSGVEIDQNHVDKRILGGKGLQYEDSTCTTFVRPVYVYRQVEPGKTGGSFQREKTIRQKRMCL